jgi:hypothetical protein
MVDHIKAERILCKREEVGVITTLAPVLASIPALEEEEPTSFGLSATLREKRKLRQWNLIDS